MVTEIPKLKRAYFQTLAAALAVYWFQCRKTGSRFANVTFLPNGYRVDWIERRR